MINELDYLIKRAGKNANVHGWLVVWNESHKSPDMRNISIGECLCLIHSEISEALEAYRKEDMNNFNEEIADIFIRLFHLCHDLDIDISHEINQKMNYNEKRPKHHGKKNL